jgi:hypothetical protein
MYWEVVLETSQYIVFSYTMLHCIPGDTMDRDIPIPLTGGDLSQLSIFLTPRDGAVVGTVRYLNQADKFKLIARNSDTATVQRGSGFSYLAIGSQTFQPNDPHTPNFKIQWGTVDPKFFVASNQPGDWNSWNSEDTRFPETFSQKPAVLVTPVAFSVPLGETGLRYAFPIGIAKNITTQGFQLEARNCEYAGGDVYFNWLAIGPL